jgi:hypothetical protein
MIRIIDGRGTGKTSRLMLLAKEQNGIIVCHDPDIYQKKAWNYGLTGIDFISYSGYLRDLQERRHGYADRPIFIDELDSLLKYLHSNIAGYSLSQDSNI